MVLSLKKTVLFLCLFALLAGTAVPVRAETAEIAAKAAIVMEPYTGTVLYEKDADAELLVASTTKIMTAMVVLENCGLSEQVTVLREHAEVEGSTMYLRAGETYTVEELLYGLMLASGNDAAAALADHCAGSMEAFAEKMNAKCAALGLEHTHVANAHGLDAPGHYSSARDLAKITAAAMENAKFCEIFSTVSYSTHGNTFVNHNKLLERCEGCIGGKTGYTSAAGRILVSVVERGGMRLICVTISDPDDWDDHEALYDACFAAWRFISPLSQDWQQLETISGTKEYVHLRCGERGFVVPASAKVRLRARLPRFVFAPVLAGDLAGTVEVWVEGDLDHTVEVWYGETVGADRTIALSAWERFKRLWSLSGGTGVYYFAG